METPDELVVRRVTVDLPGGRYLRLERWPEEVTLSVVWPETPAAGAERLRIPRSVLGELGDALRSLEGED